MARLAVAVVLGWVFSALVLPDSGKKELRRSVEALKKVDTFHDILTADTSSQRTEEEAELVRSADSFHRKTRVETGSGRSRYG